MFGTSSYQLRLF
uniref:Uncharacterized protein n=1 Tax=Arundo donax TaxID=35708 RepID=A0A0A9BCR0_ARUDO